MRITAKQKNQIKKLAKKYGLRLVLVFGSRIIEGGEYLHKFSDIDIAILPEKKLNLMDEGKITLDLMRIFKINKLDLVNLKKANPLIMYQIFNNYLALYKDSDYVLTDYEIYAFKKFIEAKTLYEMSDKKFEEKIKEYEKDLSYT